MNWPGIAKVRKEMKKEKISVIIPVYNGAAWLEESVQSVLAQTYANFELLILDDSSTDGTTALAKRLSERDPRIRLICRKRRGVSSARNQGLEEMDGEYVTFVDADDKIDCQFLEKLLISLEKENSDLILCGYNAWNGKNDRKITRNTKDSFNSENTVNEKKERENSDKITCHGNMTEKEQSCVTTIAAKDYLSDYLLRGYTRCWSILYRRSVIGEVRFREDLTIGEDMMFLMDLLPCLSQVSITDYKGYYYRVNTAGAMLRPFTLSYMDEIRSWKLAAEMIARDYPLLKARVSGILAVSSMLAAGKLAGLSAGERQKYRKCVAQCRHTVKDALTVPGAKKELPKGYPAKTAIFSVCPAVYLWLYHLWNRYMRNRRKHGMRDDSIVLYMHAGSGNHGCEAIVNSLCRLLPRPAVLVTNRAEEDERYSLKGLCREIIQEKSIEKNVLVHIWYYGYRKLFHDPESFMRYRYRAVCGKNAKMLNISIGGDNYCYDNMLDRLILSNRMFHAQGGKTMLYGCSIEPDVLRHPEILEDMKRYDAIVARESITCEALKRAGITENVHLYPDPAFLLEAEELPLPSGWVEGEMLGINLSPMVMENENKSGITMKNYKALISHILKTTKLHIALIPHVVWGSNDDRKPMRELYDTFCETGRILQIADASAPQLKGYIGRCRMFIGARTHATIAAYSSCVPTLVVGYSVKARGIAKDLFGTAENYVLPVQKLEREEDLVNAFEWLKANEDGMKNGLKAVMPGYQSRAENVRELIGKMCQDGKIWT